MRRAVTVVMWVVNPALVKAKVFVADRPRSTWLRVTADPACYALRIPNPYTSPTHALSVLV